MRVDGVYNDVRKMGVIADTHGLLRLEAINAVLGCDLILHAGDVGHPDVLGELGRLAPVVAIRGNVDRGRWAEALPEEQVVTVNGMKIYMLHDSKRLTIDPVAEGYAMVVSGHSHVPLIRHLDGVLYLNPGSAGPRRFSLPISLAVVHVERRTFDAEIIELIRIN